MDTDIPFSDYLQLVNLAFEWARSYDTKDWERLRECLAPSIQLDFRSLRGPLHENLSPDSYVAILTKVISDKRMATQHHIGGSHWQRLGDGTIQASHQLRVAHQRYADETLAVVVNHGHGHRMATHWYRKIESSWKIEAVAVENAWSEYDLYGTLDPSLKKE